MAQVLSTIQVWFDWVSSEQRSFSGENLSWRNGWKVSFWFLLNKEWLRMGNSALLCLRETEALWDPDDFLN